MNLEIIAELAQGFEGNVVKASLLLKSAAKAGANSAKFQLIYADELSTPDYKFYSLFKTLEMSDDNWQSLAAEANELGIELQFDIFGDQSLRKSIELGIKTIKVHPTDVANIALLAKIADSPIPRVLLGVGGASLTEIDIAVAALQEKKIVLLLGFQGYPTTTSANQISRVALFKSKFHDKSNIQIGFADHAEPETGFATLLGSMAVGAGISLIEKHLTLNRALEMEDFESALNPDEFAFFCNTMHSVATALGSSSDTEYFGMSLDELNYRKAIRRHVVSTKTIAKGEQIFPVHLTLKRTSRSDSLTELSLAYNKTASQIIGANMPISEVDFH